MLNWRTELKGQLLGMQAQCFGSYFLGDVRNIEFSMNFPNVKLMKNASGYLGGVKQTCVCFWLTGC